METEKTGVVYRIYHKASMKSYIGKSISPERRIPRHLSGWSDSPAIHNATKKYGKDAFCVEILESGVPEAILSKLEILHIRFFNSKCPNGYNLTDGGEGLSGWKPSPENIQKMSEAHKGQIPWMKGKKHSPEARRKMSEALKGKNKGAKNSFYGKNHSPEARRKISEARKGKPSPRKGKSHLEGSRRKMSEASKGQIPWNKGKTGIYSDETLQKMSEASKDNTFFKGKTHTPESRTKMSDAHKGKKLSSEHRLKISEASKGAKNGFYGKNHSPEARRKMSKAQKGKSHSPETRRKMSESHKRRNRSA